MENSINVIGKPIINYVIAPVLVQQLQSFSYSIPLDLSKFDKTGVFLFDYRLTADPRVTERTVDLSVLGELNKCYLPEAKLYDMDPQEDLVQVVISDRVINCALVAFENSGVLAFNLNSTNIRKTFD